MPSSYAQPYRESAASLAATLAAAPSPQPRLSVLPEPPATPEAPPRRRHLRLLVGALLAATALVALLSDPARVADHPRVFVTLVAAVVALDLIRIDVFERANVSPASVPAIALALLFGPLGPIGAEAAIALARAARHEQPIKWTFDLGALGLAGAVSAMAGGVVGTGGSGQLLLAALVTALVAYAASSALVSVVMWFTVGESPVAAWREQFAWLWPHYLAFGVLAGALVAAERAIGAWAPIAFGVPLLMLWIGEQQYLTRSRDSVRTLRERAAQLELLADEKAQLLEDAHRSYLSTIATLGRAVQALDPYAAGRTERVSRMARLLAGELEFTPEDVHAVNVGVVLHDIGRIGAPAGDPREAELSEHILGELRLPDVVREMARHHLERYDGGGGPDGLSGEEIPLAARIVAVADALDAKTSAGPGRPALPLDAALVEFELEKGTRWCPRVVEAMRRCLDRDPALRRYFGDEEVASYAA
jgi:HD domain